MKHGYVLARNKLVTEFFTSSSAYDNAKWVSISEATIYPTAEIAQSAMTKLLKNGSYSTCLRHITEILDMNPNKPDELADQGNGDEQYQDPKDQMKAGMLDDENVDDINLDDDDVESLDDEQDENSDEVEDNILGDELDPQHSDRVHPGHPQDQEENEQAFLSPLEQAMSKGKRPTQQNIRRAPRLGEAVNPNIRNTQSNIPLHKKPTKGQGHVGPTKLSDEEVCKMRTMHNKDASKSEIEKKWPNIAVGTIKSILNYDTRLTPACEPVKETYSHKDQSEATSSDNKTIATDLPKPKKIQYKQNINDPADVNFANDIDSLHNPHSTPANITKCLKDCIKEFQSAAEYNNGKDDAQSSMALTIASALQDILTDLEQGTEEGFKQAQIRITTYWNGITSNFPPEVIDYLYKRGRQPSSLKNIFYDTWNSKKQEDND